EQPGVLEMDLAAQRPVEQGIDLALELLEQRVDDVVLVAKVIVEVPRADVHLVGDRTGRDVRLAEIVEQPQRQFEDALTGPPWRLSLHASPVEWLPRRGAWSAMRDARRCISRRECTVTASTRCRASGGRSG